MKKIKYYFKVYKAFLITEFLNIIPYDFLCKIIPPFIWEPISRKTDSYLYKIRYIKRGVKYDQKLDYDNWPLNYRLPLSYADNQKVINHMGKK